MALSPSALGVAGHWFSSYEALENEKDIFRTLGNCSCQRKYSRDAAEDEPTMSLRALPNNPPTFAIITQDPNRPTQSPIPIIPQKVPRSRSNLILHSTVQISPPLPPLSPIAPARTIKRLVPAPWILGGRELCFRNTIQYIHNLSDQPVTAGQRIYPASLDPHFASGRIQGGHFSMDGEIPV